MGSRRLNQKKEKPNNNANLTTYPIVEDCTNSPRNIHDPSIFSGLLRDALRQSKIDLQQSIPSFLDSPFDDGFYVKYQVKNDPVHGRGLFVTEDVPKGAMVWSGELAKWRSARDFLAFLRYLPQDLQCDVLLWAYPEKDSADKVALAMDEGSYMNDCNGNKDIMTVSSSGKTVRHLNEGEELVEDYSSFIDMEGEVQWFHKLRAKVYGNGEYTQQGAPSNSSNTRENPPSSLSFGETATNMGNLLQELDVLPKPSFSEKNNLNLAFALMILLSFLAMVVRRKVMLRSKVHGQ
jgi:hypothetical protein